MESACAYKNTGSSHLNIWVGLFLLQGKLSFTHNLCFFRNMMFTTQDKENDVNFGANCAVLYRGGWWYNKCHCSNLNGLYQGGSHPRGVVWHSFSSQWYSLKHVEMKFRPNWDSSTGKKLSKLTRLATNRPHEGRFWKSRNWLRPTYSSAPISSKLFQLSMPTKSWFFFYKPLSHGFLSCLSSPHHSLFWSFYTIVCHKFA